MADDIPDFSEGITGQAEAEAWLRERSREDSLFIATRAALRCLPFSSAQLDTMPDLLRRRVLPAMFRSVASTWLFLVLIAEGDRTTATRAASAARSPRYVELGRSIGDDIGDEAAGFASVSSRAAIAAMDNLADAARADDGALAARVAAMNGTSLSSLHGAAARSDAVALIASRSLRTLLATPLWADGKDKKTIAAWARLKDYLERFPDEDWQVWIDWYDARLSGGKLDPERECAYMVGLEVDGEHVSVASNAEIARRLAEIASRRMPLAEDLVPDPETGLFEVRPREIAKPDLLAATLELVGDALDDALDEPSNGLNDRSLETRRLRRMLQRYANDPQRVEMDLTTIHGMVTAKIASEELPPSDANTALLTAMEEGVRGIRATHPEVAENR